MPQQPIENRLTAILAADVAGYSRLVGRDEICPMNRRAFFAILYGVHDASGFSVQAQQSERMRRIGVLLNLAEDDPETRIRLDAFLKRLRELGWSAGQNLAIDYRWGLGETERHRKNAVELVALNPDVILVHGSTILRPLQQVSRSIPIVFVSVSDPVAGGFVSSLSKPGGNATGFTSTDYGMSGKWVELLKQIAPEVTRVGIIRDPAQVSAGGQLGAIQAVAPLLRVECDPLGVRDTAEIERAIAEFASRPHGGLIVTTSALAQIHRDLIISLAAQHRLPAVYPYRLFSLSGGLLSNGPSIIDEYRRAAGYVDRILNGEKPADLAVQQPTKYELVINLKTAKALGLTVPPSLVVRADEVIE